MREKPSVLDRADGPSFWDAPWPSDTCRTPYGTIDPTGYPTGAGAAADLFSVLVDSYVARARRLVGGFGLHVPAVFRFDGPMQTVLPPAIDRPGASDPVVLCALDGSGHRPPLRLEWIEDSLGDPFLVSNLLLFGPQSAHSLRSGTTYLAAVTTELAHPWVRRLDDAIAARIEAAGIDLRVLAAWTIFTTQDVEGEADCLRKAAVDFLTRRPPSRRWREAVSLSYRNGTTPSGKPAVEMTTEFADGSADRIWLDAMAPFSPFEIDLRPGAGYPFRVFEAEIPVPFFTGLGTRPYANPGIGMLADTGRDDGAIRFRYGPGGPELARQPETDWKRIVIQVPVDATGAPLPARLLVWDHGTGGTAYNAVQRVEQADRCGEIAGCLAEARRLVLSHDQPLFGARFPLVDSGFYSYSAAYNIVNLTAFRDYLRQAGVESWYVRRWIEAAWETEVRPRLPSGTVLSFSDPCKLGHSLGSVTAGLALWHHRGENAYSRVLLSGAGGRFSRYFLDSALLDSLSEDQHEGIAGMLRMLGVDRPSRWTPAELFGAVAGIPEAVRTRLDVFHPFFVLLQSVLDPGDPASFAAGIREPVTVFRGIGDRQVPNEATALLVSMLPQVTLIDAELEDGTDPHYALFRTDAALAGLRDFLQSGPG